MPAPTLLEKRNKFLKELPWPHSFSPDVVVNGSCIFRKNMYFYKVFLNKQSDALIFQSYVKPNGQIIEETFKFIDYTDFSAVSFMSNEENPIWISWKREAELEAVTTGLRKMCEAIRIFGTFIF
jgi:hypothetical protein